jgi:hypothetical protein
MVLVLMVLVLYGIGIGGIGFAKFWFCFGFEILKRNYFQAMKL